MENCGSWPSWKKRRHDLGLDRVDRLIALGLRGDLVGLPQFVLGHLLHRGFDRGLVGNDEFARLFGSLFGEPDDRLDDRLEAAMPGHHRVEHHRLGQFLGLRFDHQNGVGGAGDDEVEPRILHLVDRRIELQLAADEADAGAADRTHERNARQRQRRRSGDHRQHVRIVFEIVAENGDDDLRVVAIAVGEQRPDRPVDEARHQRLFFRRAAFALEVAAGDPPGREGLFLIIDGEREKVDAGLRRLHRHDGGEHRRFAIAGKHRAVGLAGKTAGFEHELAPGPVELFTMHFEHDLSSFMDMYCGLGKYERP